MPVSRLTRRRRSSLGLTSLNPIKPGNYGITTSPRGVTFAPNVTPGTFVEETDGGDDLAAEVPSPSDALFPPAETPAPVPTRRRAPPGKRRSQGYIPRPPNAFMLFRANFVRQKHVPGSIETNHGSLSKIIGNCWKALPDQEKKVWEARAKKAKAEHKEMYPNYRFKPVHNKNKNKNKKDKTPLDEPDERRCEEVAQLLLEGKKGDELAAAVRRLDIDRRREATRSQSPAPFHAPFMGASAPMYAHRRSSSVPPMFSGLHAPIAIPTVPSFMSNWTGSRPDTPVNNIARLNRGNEFDPSRLRRPSSAGPSYMCTWGPAPVPFTLNDLQPDPEPLPNIDTSLFHPAFLNQSVDFSGLGAPQHTTSHPAELNQQWMHSSAISPLDSSADPLSAASTSMSSAYPYPTLTPADGMQPIPWMPQDEITPSASPSGFSATPPPTDFEAQTDMSLGIGMYANAANPAQWGQQEVAIAHADGGAVGHDALVYSQGEYIDPGMHMQEYYAGVDHYGAAAGCGVESTDAYTHAPYPEEMQFHHPVEISQYS